MAGIEKPELRLAFTWVDDQGDNEYLVGGPISEPVTAEHIEEVAGRLAWMVSQMLAMEGVIPPLKPEEK